MQVWKGVGFCPTGLEVNTKKTKIVVGDLDAGVNYKSEKYPCGLCQKGVGSNSIKCIKYK